MIRNTCCMCISNCLQTLESQNLVHLNTVLFIYLFVLHVNFYRTITNKHIVMGTENNSITNVILVFG